MARRIIQNKPRPIKTTIHPDLYNAINKFRVDYMKLNGSYLNHSMATELLAKRISKIKPPKFGNRRKLGI